MKKITFLLVAMLAFCWQGHAQSTATQNFGTNGTDSAPTVLTINVGDITVNSGQPLQAVSLGTFTSHYSSPTGSTTWCGDWYAFDLAVTGGVADGTSIPAGCDADFNGLDVTGFTTITLTSNDIDAYSDTVYFDIDLDITYLTPSCTPAIVDSSTVVDDCGNSQFSVDVVVSTVGDGTSITDGLGGSFPVASGTVTAGPYTIGDVINLTVEHTVAACNFSLGDFSTGCTLPGEVCDNAVTLTPGTPQAGATTTGAGSLSDSNTAPNVNPCSTIYNDLEYWFEYTAIETGETLDITVSDLTNTYYGVFVLDNCPDSSPTCVASDTNSSSSADLALTTPALTAGVTYYIVVTDWIQGPTTFTMNSTVNAAPTCLEVTNLDVTVLPGDTSATVSWDVEGSATLGYNWAVMNAFEDPDVDAPVASGSTAAGVTTDLASGLTAGNDYDFYVQSNCDTNGLSTWAGPFSFTSLAPPANDECADAIALTVNPDYACGTVTSGTVAGATDSGVNVCGGTEDDDVWYSFVATATEHRVSLINIAGSTVDMYHAVYDATPGCGALTESIRCNDGNTSDLTGLTIGNTYYVQVYTWTSTGGQTSTFDICVGTPPTCYDPSNLSAAFVAPNSADLSWDAPTQGTAPTAYNWEVVPAGNGQGNGIVDSGSAAGLTATATGLTANTLYDFYVQSDCGGGDTSSWAGPFTFNAGYCIPTGTSSSTYIDNFTTTGAAGVNIDNSASGFATGNYGDYYSTHYVELASDQNFDFSVGIVGGTLGAAIWIDWNNDFVFDLSEVVYSTTGYGSGPFTGTITVPNGTANGDYRMRVLIDYNDSNPGDDDACSFGYGRGEVEDYKITVDNSLSVANLEISQFTYFPNPVNNTLSLRGVKDIQDVAVYNMLGQEVLRTAPNSVNSDVDMSGLQSGTYFVKVMIENTTKTIKVIKK
jgi:hypothetical protein